MRRPFSLALIVVALAVALPFLRPAPSASAQTVPRSNVLTITPNVPIPGGFEGSQEVNDTLFARYLGAFFVYFIGVVGILAVVMMMWGGFHYITSAGNAQKMQSGKETITNALIGLVLALTSILLLRLINPSLVSFRGILPGYLTGIVQTFEERAQEDKPGAAVTFDPRQFPIIAARVRQGGYDAMVRNEAARYASAGPEFKYQLMALLFIESAGNPRAMSTFTRKDNTVGHACGLVQLLPETAGVNCEELFKPDVNIRLAARYFSGLVQNACPPADKKIPCSSGPVCNPTDITYAYAAYNGGRGANNCSQDCRGKTWWQCTTNDGFGQTRSYVGRAQAAYTWIKANLSF